MSEEFPELIGKYKVSGIIAKGGMGVVYKAFHPSLKRYVVIKKMTARGKSGNAERFKKEAQILLDLQSPYIVHLFDYFTEAGFRYMVEELVDGQALDTLIKKQSCLPVPVAMLVMQDACYALKYAHSKEIVHRDIKPGNILISKRGEVKLADFGIASDSGSDEITKSGIALGTPAYMPQEQFEDSAKVDNRADIYALGIMLYEMITGTKPYPGSFSVETLNIIKKGKYIKPRKIDKSIPKEVENLIKKMIKPKAKQRFQNIDGVLKIVKKYLHHYDTHELRVQLAKSVMTTKQYQFPQFVPKDKVQQIIKKSIACVALIALIFVGAWKSGLIHRFILRKWYTPVSIQMIMPKSLSDNMDLPARAFFFINDSDKIPEVPGSRCNFYVKGSRISEKIFSLIKKEKIMNGTAKNQIYESKSVYLKKGDYRVKVVVGPYVWWKSFEVDEKTNILKCDFLENKKRNLKVDVNCYDSETGKLVSENCSYQIFYNNSWTNLSEIPPEELRSASVWKIKAGAEGYESELFSLLIDWFQDEISVSAMLKKNPEIEIK